MRLKIVTGGSHLGPERVKINRPFCASMKYFQGKSMGSGTGQVIDAACWILCTPSLVVLFISFRKYGFLFAQQLRHVEKPSDGRARCVAALVLKFVFDSGIRDGLPPCPTGDQDMWAWWASPPRRVLCIRSECCKRVRGWWPVAVYGVALA